MHSSATGRLCGPGISYEQPLGVASTPGIHGTSAAIVDTLGDAARHYAEEAADDPESASKAKIVVYISLAEAGELVLARIVLPDHPAPIFLAQDISSIAVLDRFHKGHENLYGAGIDSKTELATHVRRAIADWIAEEARLYGGNNRQVGGGIDVVEGDLQVAHYIHKAMVERD